MHSIISEIFTNSATTIWGKELKRSSFWGCGSNNNGIFHGTMIFKGLYYICNSWSFLSNSNINTIELFILFTALKVNLLVDNCVNSDSCFTSLSITNDQFTLSTSNGYKTINSLKSSLHRFMYRFSWNNTRSFYLYSLTLIRIYSTFTIYRYT